eukprot:5198514-Karenia_brevis.AAC.1
MLWELSQAYRRRVPWNNQVTPGPAVEGRGGTASPRADEMQTNMSDRQAELRGGTASSSSSSSSTSSSSSRSGPT